MSTRRPPRPHSTFVLVAAVLAVVAFGLAGCEYSSSLDEMRCDDDSECPGDSECSENYCTDPVDELVDTVEIEPDQTTVIEGESAQFEATAVDEDGETVESARITWDSSNSEVLSLDEEEPGRFEANEPGEAIVTASSGGSYGTARVTVEQVPADSVEIEPESLDAIVGDREQLSATVLDEDGEELEDRPVEWDVEDSDIAFVNRDGELRTIGSGTTDVVATSGEASGEMDLTVSEADIGSVSLSPSEVEIVQGDSFELRATVLDSNGELIEDGNMTWESDKEEVATVDDGRVEAVGEGTATITADSEGQTAQAEVTVLPARVDAIDVSPTEMQLQVDREKDLSAQALDSGGNALDWPDLDWTSSDQDILEVVTSNDDSSLNDGEARVEARQTGTARVTVSTERSQAEDEEGSVERSVAVTVINEQPDAMDELTTDPSSATIEIGKSLDIETAVKDDQDDDIDWNIDWSSSKDSVASVSSNGRVTGHSVGSTSITARAVDETGEPIEDSNNDPIEESVNIDVEQKSVDSIHVWPSSASIEEEQSIELFAQLRSSDGTVLDSGSIEWSGDSNEVDIDTGSDDRSAEVTAKSLDDDSGITSTIDVEATDGDGNDITETIQLDIDPQSVARIDMDPMVATLSIDGSASDHTVDIDATPQNAQGDTLEGRDVSWSVTDGNNNVDLDDNQSPVVVEAKEPGEATIKATSGDATGRTYIDVENQPPEAEDDDDGNVVGENDSKVDIDVLANDDDPDGDNSELEITRIVVDPVGGDLSWSASSPTIEYDPKDFHGEDGFVYEVEDEWGATDTAWVSVDVDKINGPTAAATCSYDSNNERIDLDATDSELPDGRPVDITWTLDSKPSDSDRESDDIDNRYSIETSLDPDENGTYDFELELTDSDGNSDTAQCDADAEGL